MEIGEIGEIGETAAPSLEPTAGGEEWSPPARRGGWLRVALRGSGLVGIAFVFWGVWAVAGTLARPFPTARRRLRRFVYATWGRGVIRILGVRAEVRGAPPSGPCFLVSNHLSWLDVPLIASSFECTFVAKAEIIDWRVAGRLARSMDTIFVDRDRHRDIPQVNATIEGALASGLGVVVFAEGQSTRGSAVGPFRSSLLEPAARSDARIGYACVHYEAPPGAAPASQVVCYWGEAGFAEHVVALLREPAGYRAVLTFGEETLEIRERKELARRLHARVSDLFRPVT